MNLNNGISFNCIFTHVIHKRKQIVKLYKGLIRKKIAVNVKQEKRNTIKTNKFLDSKYFKSLTSYEHTNTPTLNTKTAFTHHPPQCNKNKITTQYNIVVINNRTL